VNPSMPFRVVDERADRDTVRFTLVVPEDCPFFEGHFPGQPVLPAIGQLAMLEVLLRRTVGSSVVLSGVDGFKLSRQILPGDRVEIRVEVRRAAGEADFVVRRDGNPVSRGTLRMAETVLQ